MRTMMKWLAAMVCVWLMVGCATPPKPLPVEQASGIRRVAVVARTSDVFTRKYTGMTVFNNEMDSRDVSAWQLDQVYERQVAGVLRQEFGLTVIEAPYDAAAFEHMNDLNGPWSAPAFWGPNWGAIEGAVKAHCAAHQLDAIVGLAKMNTNDVLAGTNQSYGGLGLYGRGPGARLAVLHYFAKLAVLDCRTGKLLAERIVSRLHDALPGEVIRNAPLRAVDPELVTLPLAQWSEPQLTKLQADLTALPGSAWLVTLQTLLPPKH